MAADTLATLRSCLPTQTPPHTNVLAMAGIRVPVSARSQDAVDACSLAVVIWLTRDRARHTEAESS